MASSAAGASTEVYSKAEQKMPTCVRAQAFDLSAPHRARVGGALRTPRARLARAGRVRDTHTLASARPTAPFFHPPARPQPVPRRRRARLLRVPSCREADVAARAAVGRRPRARVRLTRAAPRSPCRSRKSDEPTPPARPPRPLQLRGRRDGGARKAAARGQGRRREESVEKKVISYIGARLLVARISRADLYLVNDAVNLRVGSGEEGAARGGGRECPAPRRAAPRRAAHLHELVGVDGGLCEGAEPVHVL